MQTMLTYAKEFNGQIQQIWLEVLAHAAFAVSTCCGLCPFLGTKCLLIIIGAMGVDDDVTKHRSVYVERLNGWLCTDGSFVFRVGGCSSLLQTCIGSVCLRWGRTAVLPIEILRGKLRAPETRRHCRLRSSTTAQTINRLLQQWMLLGTQQKKETV